MWWASILYFSSIHQNAYNSEAGGILSLCTPTQVLSLSWLDLSALRGRVHTVLDWHLPNSSGNLLRSFLDSNISEMYLFLSAWTFVSSASMGFTQCQPEKRGVISLHNWNTCVGERGLWKKKKLTEDMPPASLNLVMQKALSLYTKTSDFLVQVCHVLLSIASWIFYRMILCEWIIAMCDFLLCSNILHKVLFYATLPKKTTPWVVCTSSSC